MLTKTRQPYEWSPAYNPVIYEYQSSFVNQYIGSGLVVTGFASVNGFLEYTFGSPHGWVVGDPLFSEVSPLLQQPYYAGLQYVYQVTGVNSVVTNIPYDNIGLFPVTTVYKYAGSYRASMRLYANNGTDILLGEIRQPAILESGVPKFLFDVSGILRDYINAEGYDVDLVNGFASNPNSFLKYRVSVAEEYDQGNGTSTVYVNHGYIDDETPGYQLNYRWALNAAFQYEELVGQADKLAGFIVNGDQQARFLTDMPAPFSRMSNVQRRWLYWITDGSVSSWWMRLRTKDAAGIELSNEHVMLGSSTTAGSFRLMFDFAALVTGKYACAQLFTGGTSSDGYLGNNFTDGGGGNTTLADMPSHPFQPGDTIRITTEVPYTPDYTGEYTVISVTDHSVTFNHPFEGSLPGDPVITAYLVSPEVAISEELCWTTDEKCQRYETQVLALNKKGGCDTLVMNGKRKKELNVSRDGDIKYPVLPDRFNPKNRQISNLRNDSLSSITVAHNERSSEVTKWILPVFMETPDAYLIENDLLLPVNVTRDNIIYLSDGDKVNSFELPFMYAFERVTQTR